jgi:GH43 family beta-xylosidase
MITIKNYNNDMNYGVFFNWDMKYAMEDKGFYSFEFEHRNEGKRVYVMMHREPTADGFHEVYIQDMKDLWKKTVHIAPNHLNKSAFYNFIESVIDDEYGLPF